MHSQQTIDALAELHDLAAWMDRMPAVPGHHRNGDALFETYENVVGDVLSREPDIASALEFVLAEESNSDGWDTMAAQWRDVAQAMEIELVLVD